MIKYVLFYTFALTFINIEDTECTYDFQKAVVATVYERIGLFSYRNATFCSTMVVIKCTSNNYYLSKQYTVCIPVIQTSTTLICLTIWFLWILCCLLSGTCNKCIRKFRNHSECFRFYI